MIFDTLKLSKSLQKAFTPEQAEALTEALNESAINQLVTKTDLDIALTNQKVVLVRWIVSAIAFNLLATAGLMITPIKTLL